MEHLAENPKFRENLTVKFPPNEVSADKGRICPARVALRTAKKLGEKGVVIPPDELGVKTCQYVRDILALSPRPLTDSKISNALIKILKIEYNQLKISEPPFQSHTGAILHSTPPPLPPK